MGRHDRRVTTYRIAEAAELLGVSDDTVRRWVEAGPGAGQRPRAAHGAGAGVAGLAEELAEGAEAPTASGPGPPVSARNRLAGIVTRVRRTP